MSQMSKAKLKGSGLWCWPALLYAIQAFFGISSCIVSPLFWLALAMVNNRGCELK